MYRLRRYFPPDSRPRQAAGRPAGADGAPDDDVGGHVGRHPRGRRGRHPARRRASTRGSSTSARPTRSRAAWDRNLADHIVALSDAIDTVTTHTGQDVHLAGYSQGGMFATRPPRTGGRRTSPASSRSARRSTPWPRCRWASRPNIGAPAADFMADHVFNRLDIPGWMARTGFQMLDPLKTAKSRVDFVRQLHDREALLPREQQRRFLDVRGLDRLVRPGGRRTAQAVHRAQPDDDRRLRRSTARLVTLTDITCPVLAFVGEVDDIGQPAAVRGIRGRRRRPRSTRSTYPRRPFRPGGRDPRRRSTPGRPSPTGCTGVTGAATSRTNIDRWMTSRDEHADETGVVAQLPDLHTASARSSEVGARHGPRAADAIVTANRSVRTAGRRDGTRRCRGWPGWARSTTTPGSRWAASSPSRRTSRPNGEFLLFDGRVHTYEAVNRRINNVVRGLIEVGRAPGRPRGCADGDPAQRAGGDRRAVPARCGCRADAAGRRPGRGGPARRGDRDHLTDPDQPRAPRASRRRPGAGARRRRVRGSEPDPTTATSSTWSRSTRTPSSCPAWYRPNPGLARDLAFIAFARSGGDAGGQADHQLPVGAVGLRNRLGGRARPRRHRVLPDPAASPVGPAGRPSAARSSAAPGSRCPAVWTRTGSSRRSASTA